MLLAAHVPQGLRAPDTASQTLNYSRTLRNQPATPISLRFKLREGSPSAPGMTFPHTAIIDGKDGPYDADEQVNE